MTTNNIESVLPEQLMQDLTTQPDPKTDELGQDEFLKLMLAQLKHQDPFKPMENGEFVSQMAQISTVAGIEGMEASLGNMSESFASNQLLQSSSLIGKTALINGSEAPLGPENDINAYYRLPNSVGSVQLNVYSPTGELIHNSTVNAQPAGLHNFNWDGSLENGERAPTGTYTFQAIYGNGESQTQANISVENTIASVSLDPGATAVSFETAEGNTITLQDIEKLQ